MSSQYLVAPIPLGEDGLYGSKNISKFKPTHLLSARNVSFADGLISMEGGSAKYNAVAISGNPTILGGTEWHPTTALHRVIVFTSAGAILRDDGAGTFPTTLKTGLSTTALPFFVNGGAEVAANNKKLFIFNGANIVQVISGDATVTNNLTTPPADWSGGNQPSFGAIHEFRLWAGGNSNDPHRIYYSVPGSHEDFTGANSGSIAIYSGEGDAIVAALSFKGYLIVWKKPVGVYIIDTTNPTVANWKVRKLSGSVGTPNAYGAFQIDDDIIFMDIVGNIQSISSVSETVDLRSRNISQIAEIVPFIKTEINMHNLVNIQSVYYPTRREAHFAMPGTGSVVNNKRLVIDFNRVSLPRFRFSDKDINNAIWLDIDSDDVIDMYSGDDNGFVWKLDQDIKSVDGNAFVAEFQTAYTDLSYIDPSYAVKNKYGAFLEIIGEPKGDWIITADIFWDGKQTSTVTFNMGAGANLGAFILGTDKLSGKFLLHRKKRIVGGGRRLSIRFKSNVINSDFALSNAYLHYNLGDESLRS